jgi:triosephosphate isomerase
VTRARIVIGNWKMNPLTAAAATQLARAAAETAARSTVRVGVAPPALFIPAVSESLRDSKVAVYGQDVSWEAKGAFTGQIAAPMLTPFVTGALVGHSEVRRYLGDDDERVAKKLIQALRAGLEAVLCVGEREDEYDAGTTEDVLAAQLAPALAALKAADADGRMSERFVVAYEPVWAIGTGRPASAEHASAAAKTIRRVMDDEGSLDGDAIPILYGGSVTAAGAGEFAKAEGIDGALVGGASLVAEEFAGIVRAFA